MTGIDARAAELGIEPAYTDAHGVCRNVPQETLAHLVRALAGGRGVPAAHRPSLIWRRGRTHVVELGPPWNASDWQICSADNAVVAAGATDTSRIILDESLPDGVYRLIARSASRDAAFATSFIVAPETAYRLDDAPAERLWLLAVQLYAVRSQSNWGHGDFTDLRDLLRLCARIGAAGVGLNPLHALFDDRPEHASPYSPNSRLFLNPLYIDVSSIPEFAEAGAADLAEQIAQARRGDIVDYQAVAALKRAGLRRAYAVFQAGGSATRARDFAVFREERGLALSHFAAFEVLRRKFQRPWWDWPRQWRRPTEANLATLRKEARDELDFYAFVQWIADSQLAACRDEARQLGLPIGLYLDVAVGVEPNGADAWSGQDCIVRNAEVGAPPDLLNTEGQAWGLAALSPIGLEARGFAPFRDMLRAAMRHAGAIRLDHVLGLNRSFLIPFGSSAKDGAYVRYPLHALLATVALESVAHRCLVIGEDLGTVPEGFRGVLADWGVWSYLVMLFERGEGGAFRPPQDYRRDALATFGTHDIASFAGWRSAHDLTVKRAIGLDPGETDEERKRAHWLFGEALAESGISRNRAWQFVDIARFLARTPSRLAAVALDDVLGVLDQPNVPGTVDQHPNWRRKLPVGLEELGGHEGLLAVARVLAEEGRSAAR